MMTQLGQVSYYPNSGYARTGAESSVPVDQTLQADSALATAPTPGDSFTSASTTAPAEPEKKKTNWLAWGAAAAGGAALITFGGKSAGWWLKEAVQEGADDLAKGADAILAKFKGFSQENLEGLNAEQLKQIHDAGDEAAAKKLLADFKPAAPTPPTPPAAAVPTPSHTAAGSTVTDEASHIADLINKGIEPAKTRVPASSLTKSGQNFKINGQAVQIQNLGYYNKLAKEAASDPRRAIELKRGTLLATGNKTKAGALEYIYRPGRIETPEVESIIAKLSAGDEEGAKALAQTNGYRIDGSRIVPSPSKGQILETGDRTFHVGTEISDVNDITNGVKGRSLRLVGADGKPLTVDLSKLTPDQQKELKFSFQSHLSYEGKPNAATEIVPAVVRVDGFTNPTGWNPFG